MESRHPLQPKNKLVAEYALRDTRKPIGVSVFKLTKALPEELKGLPYSKEVPKLSRPVMDLAGAQLSPH